jgi:cell division protein ZipA
MPANWSLIINIVLLVGVIIAIGRIMKARRESVHPDRFSPTLGKVENSPYDAQPMHDDIIAVRKVCSEEMLVDSGVEESISLSPQQHTTQQTAAPRLMPEEPKLEVAQKEPTQQKIEVPSTVMMFIVAKENRQFVGYELLQTVLASGLRFGEGQLFHRHQFVNGQGPVLCSLAAATATGVFDLQNIGAFSVRGLCLYMQSSKNPNIDSERFSVMLDTARQLRDGLDANLLDESRQPLNATRLERYFRLLQIEQGAFESA